MTKSEIKGFEKAIKILENKLILMDESLDNEKIPFVINNKIMQNSGVSLSIYTLKKELNQ